MKRSETYAGGKGAVALVADAAFAHDFAVGVAAEMINNLAGEARWTRKWFLCARRAVVVWFEIGDGEGGKGKVKCGLRGNLQ